MPVYLCRPGHASSEPWRHGVQVYAYPFRIDGLGGGGGGGGGGSAASAFRRPGSVGGGGPPSPARPPVGAAAAAAAASAAGAPAPPDHPPSDRRPIAPAPYPPAAAAAANPHQAAEAGVGVAVRRVRHSEVVLADEISVSYDRYWLRLRWPGPRGGVAGYIALGLVPPDGSGSGGSAASVVEEGNALKGASASLAGMGMGKEREFRIRTQMSEVSDLPTRPSSRRSSGLGDEGAIGNDNNDGSNVPLVSAAAVAAAAAEAAMAASAGGGAGRPEAVDTTAAGQQRDSSASPTPTAAAPAPFQPYPTPMCESTGLYFPSSSAMELLASYDDGLAADSGSADHHRPHDGDAHSVGSHLGQQIGGIFHPHHRADHEGSSAGGGGSGGGNSHSHSNSHNNASSGVSITSHTDAGEPVFCRICREGLHDVNYDLDAAGASNNQAGGSGGGGNAAAPNAQQFGIVVPPPPPPQQQAPNRGGGNAPYPTPGNYPNRPRADGGATLQPSDRSSSAPAAAAHAANAAALASSIVPHHPSAENPLLAPCSCTGSMAFVHYLCVEQWRCRSRHPSAKNGLNCETCGGVYTLPPPPTRPAGTRGGGGGGGGGVLAEEDWLEAMPPHVLAALRRPHPWWQIGTAIVRRRWLRPVAPVLMSPIVALYCRARRMLKKRGVSRRRWACSLCRRRARWKCVRCLRSYYCSRQCQNVSWHIVHKHVCYKPARFWWSLVVYGAGTVLAFPGVLRDPVVYDLGLSCLLGSFVVTGVIGGGIATAMKRGLGVDIRGRSLELAVVAMTFWLASVSWGLVWGFFGDPSRCWGVAEGIQSTTAAWWASEEAGAEAAADAAATYSTGDAAAAATATAGDAEMLVAQFWRRYLFRPAKIGIGALDKAWTMSGPLVTRLVCSTDEGDAVGDGIDDITGDAATAARTTTTCLRMARKADPEFFLPEHGGEKCSSDLMTVTSVLVLSGVILSVGAAVKKRERNRRAAAGAAARAAAAGGGGRAIARAERNAAVPRPHQD